MARHLREYGLGYVLGLLMLLSWALQWYLEVILHSNSPDAAPAIQFWAHTFENWQSEFLQLLTFVMLTKYLRFKGSHESKDVDV